MGNVRCAVIKTVTAVFYYADKITQKEHVIKNAKRSKVSVILLTESGRSEPRMSMLLFQIYQRARDRFRAGDLLSKCWKKDQNVWSPECLARARFRLREVVGASRALAVSCDRESPNRGKQGGRVPCEHSGPARALGCDAEVFLPRRAREAVMRLWGCFSFLSWAGG